MIDLKSIIHSNLENIETQIYYQIIEIKSDDFWLFVSKLIINLMNLSKNTPEYVDKHFIDLIIKNSLILINVFIRAHTKEINFFKNNR